MKGPKVLLISLIRKIKIKVRTFKLAMSKNNITNKMKLRALKFMLLGKEIKFEISYSKKYLNKIKNYVYNLSRSRN